MAVDRSALVAWYRKNRARSRGLFDLLAEEAYYGRFLEFVDAGGYRHAAWWRPEDWEWTATTFGPFPGFQAIASYPEYSSDFFDGEHFVMKGASTTRCCSAPTW